MLRSRNYVFTIHNYTKKNVSDLKKLSKELKSHNYICFGLEVAKTTGTKHIQGYIELNEGMTFSAVQKYFNLKQKGKLLKFHLDPAKGTAEQNKKYVSKEGDFFEYGEPKQQGRRRDIDLVREIILNEPKKLREFVKTSDIGYQAMKFAESLQAYAFEHRSPDIEPTVIWLYGSSGIGKTKLVYDSFDSICAVSSYDWLGEGYEQQECLLFDDFRTSDISFHLLLRICDRYPLSLAKKGGFVPLNSPYIVITTTSSIEHSYSDFSMFEDMSQLLRRCVQVNLDKENVSDLKKIKKLD